MNMNPVMNEDSKRSASALSQNEGMKDGLAKILEGNHLEQSEARNLMYSIMRGEATPAQIGGLLMALRMKGKRWTKSPVSQRRCVGRAAGFLLMAAGCSILAGLVDRGFTSSISRQPQPSLRQQFLFVWRNMAIDLLQVKLAVRMFLKRWG